MTKCRPTTRSKKAIQPVRKKAGLEKINQRTEPNKYVFLYNMRVRKIEWDKCVECS